MTMITAQECADQMAQVNHNDREGANRIIAARVNGYWAERGYMVNARIETKPCAGRQEISVIVSDTLNGLPIGFQPK